MLKVSIPAFLAIGLSAFSFSSYALDSDYVVTTAADEIKIMSYNAENLFDSFHDAGKQDWEYLPKEHSLKKNCPGARVKLESTAEATSEKPPRRNICLETDWTAAKVDMKVAQMKRVIDAAGDRPDVLTLCEVENKRVVGKLAKALGYDGFYVTDSPDVRGIDLAVLYKREKLTPMGFEERELKNPVSLTRNISVAHFRIKKSVGADGILAIYPNHWPSQANISRARLIAAEQLNTFVDEKKGEHLGENYYVVLTGDYNTIADESPNPLTDVLMASQENLLDVHALSNLSENPAKGRMPKGTYFYAARKQWNELDHIFVGANLFDKKGLEVDPTSFRIHAPSFATKKNDAGEDTPFRYNHLTTNPAWLGYSDHFALTVKLKAAK